MIFHYFVSLFSVHTTTVPDSCHEFWWSGCLHTCVSPGVVTPGLVTQTIPGAVQLQSAANPHNQMVIHGSTPLSQIGISQQPVSTQSQSSVTLQGLNTLAVGGDTAEVSDLLNKRKPKRGVLPKQATNIMRSWLFQHIVVSIVKKCKPLSRCWYEAYFKRTHRKTCEQWFVLSKMQGLYFCKCFWTFEYLLKTMWILQPKEKKYWVATECKWYVVIYEI